MSTPEHNLMYLTVAAVAWLLLVYRDAQRAQRLTALYLRTRHLLVALSLLGTLSSAVGMTLLILGVYLVATSPPGIVFEPRAARTIAVGGAFLIAGWGARLVAWVRWKRLYGAPGREDAAPPAAE
ncbi:MAG: hypothetical protein N2512_14630 [Armatimonadetes bacterium]|nr:hypothetical protein [Armatimonadota bacterium]